MAVTVWLYPTFDLAWVIAVESVPQRTAMTAYIARTIGHKLISTPGARPLRENWVSLPWVLITNVNLSFYLL